MDLWIRSQDKEKLCKVHDLCVRENQNENNETNYVIQDIYTMGTYTTKERALEVLDEIQTILRGRYATSFDYKISLKGFKTEEVQQMLELMAVYEMPKE